MITHEQVLRDLDSASKIVCLLTSVARAAFHVADDTEERCFGCNVEYVVFGPSHDKLCAALDNLEDFPDDNEEYIMDGPARAALELEKLLHNIRNWVVQTGGASNE